MIETAIQKSDAPMLISTLGGLPARGGLLDWRRWIGPILSAAVLIASVVQLRGLEIGPILQRMPSSPGFWLLFAAAYMALPASEWIIYRRLWRLPAAGIVALLGKRVSNEVLLGYSGELYFYGWARRHAGITTAPFGAIKDVAMLSAAVGNVATLILLLCAWPLLKELHLGLSARTLAISGATIAATSLVTLCFRRALFSLPRRELGFITLVHAARVLLTTVLTALLWCLVLPAAPFAWWLLLSTVRMLVSRLPFVPSKDIVFAGVVAFLIGRETETTALIALLAGLTLLVNLVLGAAIGVAELSRADRRGCA